MNNAKKIQRIGVLTGGGDCPGLNAVVRTVVKTATTQYGLEVFGIEDGFLGLIQNRIRPLRFGDVSNVLDRGGTILGTSNTADPSCYRVATNPDGSPVIADVTDRVIEYVGLRGLEAIVCIGGDGTMSGAAKMIKRGIAFVGVPKTIDNDLAFTDVTFGFDTAVSTASEAMDRIRTTAASHHRVMLVEMMGRYAGWITLHAGAACGADIILIPEIPYDLDVVCQRCLQRSRSGKAYTLVAVAEGAKPKGGKMVVDRVVHESPEPIRLGGVSEVLCEQISERTGLEGRATILGHIQRGGRPTAHDRVLATRFGYAAIELLMRGEVNRMVAIRHGEMTSVPIDEVADQQRLIPPDHPLVKACRATGVAFGDSS